MTLLPASVCDQIWVAFPHHSYKLFIVDSSILQKEQGTNYLLDSPFIPNLLYLYSAKEHVEHVLTHVP